MKRLVIIIIGLISIGYSQEVGEIFGIPWNNISEVSGVATVNISEVDGVAPPAEEFSNTHYVTFAGDDAQRIIFSDAAALALNDTEWTIIFYHKTTGNSGTEALFSKDWWLGETPSGEDRWEIRNYGTGGEFRMTGGATNRTAYTGYNDDNWHCQAIVRQSDDDGIWYTDSTTYLVRTSTDLYAGLSFENDADLIIGSSHTGTYDAEYTGSIDMFMIFNRELTTTELDNFMDLADNPATEYDNDPSLAPSPLDVIADASTSLVFWLPFGEATSGTDSFTGSFHDDSASGLSSNSITNCTNASIDSH